MRKALISIIFGYVVLIGIAAYASQPKPKQILPRLYSTDSKLPKKYSPIVRLVDNKGDFFCSGFVADDNYVITAAHCVYDAKTVMVNERTPATVIGYQGREDFALLKGDFREYGRLPFSYSTGISIALVGRMVAACGYPEGSYFVTCTPAKILGPSMFYHEAIGEMYPGMSGGPVIDIETGVVIGLNSHVSEGPRVYFSRLTGLPGRFDIEPGVVK